MRNRIIVFALIIGNALTNLSAQEVFNFSGEKIKISNLENFIKNRMQELNVPGASISIINNAELIYHKVEGYANKETKQLVNKNTIFEGASISKPLFAYFVMKIVEEGKLDLDKPLYNYLPYPDISDDERYKKITARIVLNHTSGFPNWREDYKDKKLFIQFEPGSRFHYSGEGYQYLAKVIAHIYETDLTKLDGLFQKMVAKPLGMKHTVFVQNAFTRKHKAEPYINGKRTDWKNNYWYKKNDCVFIAPASIHTEAADFSKFIIAMLNKKGLTESSFNELLKIQAEIPEGNPYRQYGINDWGLGFFRIQTPLGIMYGHGGSNITGFESLFVFSQDKKWGMSVFTNSKEGSQFVIELYQYLFQNNK